MNSPATCFFCGDAINTTMPGNYQYVEGWEKIRRSTEGGGHGLTKRIAHPKWACRSCIDKLQHGIPTNQGSMF